MATSIEAQRLDVLAARIRDTHVPRSIRHSAHRAIAIGEWLAEAKADGGIPFGGWDPLAGAGSWDIEEHRPQLHQPVSGFRHSVRRHAPQTEHHHHSPDRELLDRSDRITPR